MPSLAELRRDYSSQRLSLRAGLVQAARLIWAGLRHSSTAYDRASVPGFVDQLVPLVHEGQAQEVSLTVAMLRELSLLRTGVPTPDVDLSKLEGRQGGVSLDDVYARPFVWLWTDLKNGKPFEDALDDAADRLGKSIEADLQLASRNAADAVIDADRRTIGFKRVLSDRPNHCPLCVVASTNHYRKGDLLPIHPGCGCGVEPVYADADWDDTLNRQVADAYADAIRNQEIAVTEHGEYGPYLIAA
ncbi:hypothetical protein [Nonomuraea sp. NPDC023979]|uniref:hypothetical protein n=1 Tax=Nonomuraea sp. NPDC023979 TaxID=3154796 RepID=UPI0033DBA5CD